MSALDDVLAAVASAMHESALRWYLFGAQAATLWGRPRLTADVDITAEIPLAHGRAGLKRFRDNGALPR